MIISRKRFEQEIFERLDRERCEIYRRQQFDEMQRNYERDMAKLEYRIARLEEEIRGKKQNENSNNLQGL